LVCNLLDDIDLYFKQKGYVLSRNYLMTYQLVLNFINFVDLIILMSAFNLTIRLVKFNVFEQTLRGVSRSHSVY